MPVGWIAMRQILGTLRLAFDRRQSQHDMSLAVDLSQSTVSEYRWRPIPDSHGRNQTESWPPIASAARHDHPTVPNQVQGESADGLRLRAAPRPLHACTDTLEPVLRQVQGAGEKVFFDHAGQTMPMRHLTAASVRNAQIIVGTLGTRHQLNAGESNTAT